MTSTDEHGKNKLRIEFIYRQTSGARFRFKRRKQQLSQGTPLEYGVKVTNIGESVFLGATFSEFKITSSTDEVEIRSNKSFAIPALNCQQSIEIWCDRTVLTFKGTAVVAINIQASNQISEIELYQYDSIHDMDSTFNADKNIWVDVLFIQGELEIIQQKTNDLILWLTIITVLESVFGLNNILKFIGTGLYYLFLGATKLLEYILDI